MFIFYSPKLSSRSLVTLSENKLISLNKKLRSKRERKKKRKESSKVLEMMTFRKVFLKSLMMKKAKKKEMREIHSLIIKMLLF